MDETIGDILRASWVSARLQGGRPFLATAYVEDIWHPYGTPFEFPTRASNASRDVEEREAS